MYLSNKNHAMKDVLIWSLPSRVTCIGGTPLCEKNCYAKKAERLYPNVLMSRYENLEDTHNPKFVENMIAVIRGEVIKNKKFNSHFRIHEAGDFYSQKYLDDWMEIVFAFPKIKFLAYTKSFQLDFSHLNYFTVPNLEIVMSVWADTKMVEIPKEFPRSYVGAKREGVNDLPLVNCLTEKLKCNRCNFKCWRLSKLKKNVCIEMH
jgi:hypothetical protein